MVTIASVNVNGIRAAVKARSEINLGFLHWLKSTSAEIVCLQEVRADPGQVAMALAPACDEGWYWIGADSERKGRSGVGILSRFPSSQVQIGFPADLTGGKEFDHAGRYIQAQMYIPTSRGIKELVVSSVYIPAGEVGTPKQSEKERFLTVLSQYMQQCAQDYPLMAICGDWNIAHTVQDIKNAQGNIKKAGFLSEERAWMTSILNGVWNDSVRQLIPNGQGPYTWWSPRGKAFDTDTGWRIDYQIISQELMQYATLAWVDKANAWENRWSDHAPVLVHYDFK